MAAITVENLHKVYRSSLRREGVLGGIVDLFARKSAPVTAVDRISFSIEHGEIVGLIGPNGAGKSTTIKMLTGILKPTSGSLSVLGLVPFKQRTRYTRQIGVVFGQRTQLWWDLAVIEAFRLLKTIYRVSDTDFAERLATFAKVLDLEPLLNRQVRRLSLGQRMRCDLAASLLHNPPILFLDEPTIGMDVAVKARMREFIRLIRERFGTTIILTTHDTADIEALSDRLLVIDRGLLLFDGSLTRFKSTYGRQRSLVVDFNDSPSIARIREALSDPSLRITQPFAGRAEIVFDVHACAAHELIGRLVGAFAVRDIQTTDVEVETIIRDIYEGFSS